MNCSVVILAGGRSRRMGRDKAWLPHQGKPLVLHQVATALCLHPAQIFISARSDCSYATLGWPVLQDTFAGQGPLAGIERALALMTTPLLLVMAVDMPQLSPGVLLRLWRQCNRAAGAVPRCAGEVEPLAALYPKAAHRIALTLLGEGENRMHQFALACAMLHLVRVIDLPATQRHRFANWNTPEDLPKKRLSRVKVKATSTR